MMDKTILNHFRWMDKTKLTALKSEFFFRRCGTYYYLFADRFGELFFTFSRLSLFRIEFGKFRLVRSNVESQLTASCGGDDISSRYNLCTFLVRILPFLTFLIFTPPSDFPNSTLDCSFLFSIYGWPQISLQQKWEGIHLIYSGTARDKTSTHSWISTSVRTEWTSFFGDWIQPLPEK